MCPMRVPTRVEEHACRVRAYSRERLTCSLRLVRVRVRVKVRVRVRVRARVRVRVRVIGLGLGLGLVTCSLRPSSSMPLRA